MLSRGELRSRPVPVFSPGTRHRRDPSPPRSCSNASFRLWPLAIIPQRRNVRRQASNVERRDGAHTGKHLNNNALLCVTDDRIAQPLAPPPNAPHYWERRLISCFCFAPNVGQLFRWAPGTRSALTGRRLAALFPAGRDAVKARDALLGQCPLGQPRGVRRRGYSPTDTAHEMRIPLRPLRMSKPYRRLRKRRLRSD